MKDPVEMINRGSQSDARWHDRYNAQTTISLSQNLCGIERRDSIESILPQCYQAYILPTKFGFGKRKLHPSTLLMGGQMTREEGLEVLNGNPYQLREALEDGIEYFLRKMGWSREQLSMSCQQREIPHGRYGSGKPFSERHNRFFRFVKSAKSRVFGA